MSRLGLAIAATAVSLTLGFALFPRAAEAHLCGADHDDVHGELRYGEPLYPCWDAMVNEIDDEIETQFFGTQKEANPAERWALKDEYTAWLNTLAPACKAPERTPRQIALWREIPCTLNRLYERLDEIRGYQTMQPPLGQPLDFVHPYCLDSLVPVIGAFLTKPFSLDLCNRAYSHIPVEREGRVLRASSGRTSVGYELGGWLEDGTVVISLSSSGGGSATFDFLLFLQGVPRFTDGEPITPGSTARLVHEGVFGCTVLDLEIVGASSVRLSCLLTPRGLFRLPDLDHRYLSNPRLHRRKVDADYELSRHLSERRGSYIGTYDLLLDTETWRDEFQGVRITHLDARAGDKEECFNRALRNSLAKFRNELSTPKEINDFFVRYNALCVDPAE